MAYTVREQSMNCLTIVAHSQGTMLAMAATLLCKKRPPDALMLMNSPYALTDKFTDTVAIGKDRPTDGARLRTLQAVVDKLRPNHQRETFIDRDDVYSPGGKKRELETEEEMQQRITNWYPMPPNHSTMPMHVEFMKRVVAYDLPIGYAESYNRDDWSRLIHLADWTSFEDDYFSDGKLEVPAKPAGLDPETVSEQQRRADEARIHDGA